MTDHDGRGTALLDMNGQVRNHTEEEKQGNLVWPLGKGTTFSMMTLWCPGWYN